MISIYSSKPVRLKDLKDFDDAKRFVKPTDLWYGYEISLEEVKDKLRFGKAKLTADGITIDTNIIYYDKVILSGSHCAVNDIIYACRGTDYTMPPVEVTKMGYIDEVYKRKYISVPTNSYWDYSNNPVVMIKTKRIKKI